MTESMRRYLRDMVDSYLETALWSELNCDDYPDSNYNPPWDDDYDISNFSDNARAKAEQDCAAFIECLENIIFDCNGTTLFDCVLEDKSSSDIGYDFWLTRNGHGAGFWDGDYGAYGDIITKIVDDNFSESYIYADGNGGLELQ